jgi:hypothetical protein
MPKPCTEPSHRHARAQALTQRSHHRQFDERTIYLSYGAGKLTVSL